MTDTLDVGDIYRGLKDFQLATVEHVAERLYGSSATRRFLVADEVGLGKTLVARGLIARTIEHHLAEGTPRIDIVYICSNADIARQNVTRLNVLRRNDFTLATRITLLPRILTDLQRNRINFVSFTPGTSFNLRSSEGVMEERALLYRMLRELWGHGVVRNYKRDAKVFAGGAGYDGFLNLLQRREGDAFDATLAQQFAEELTKFEDMRPTGAPSFPERFIDLRERLARSSDPSVVPVDVRADRADFVGTLREILAKTCVEALEPDLVILDEFQRFKHLFDPDDAAGVLAQQLFDYPAVRVVLLSATPYKMYTISDEEGDDHYADFLDTLQFLMGPEKVETLSQDLRNYRSALFNASGDGTALAQSAKDRLERSLRRCMSRTERLAVTSDRSGMLTERACTDLRLETEDVRRYMALAQLSNELEVGGALPYWEATPYPLSFMDGYQLDREVERALETGEIGGLQHLDDDLLTLSRADVEAYRKLDPANVRLRWLMGDMIDSGAWKLLWVPPSMPYYGLGGPFADERLRGFTKRLVFSAWLVVPKVIGAMVSYEAERRMMQAGGESVENTSSARERFSGLLRFQRSNQRLTGMPVFALLYPSAALAELGDPRALAAELGAHDGPVSQDALLHDVRRRVAERLEPLTRSAPVDGSEDERWYWAAPLLLDLERDLDGTRVWFEHPDLASTFVRHRDDDDSDRGDVGWREHVAEAIQFVREPPKLGRVPHDLDLVIAELALAGPGVTALRALDRVNGAGVDDVGTRLHAGFVAWGIRHLFNLMDATYLLRAASSGRQREDAYWRLVLRYCLDGCLQAVLDEYVHVVREWLGLIDGRGEALLAPVSEAMREALTLRTVNYTVRHIEESDGGLAANKQRMRGLFALRFGDERSDGERNVQRSSSVRAAFNSPFRPFVLATTSVGQEGLDFHTYCHAVVHWNLPANPVDLEQREGRVHRYKGHAIRKNVATDCRPYAFAEHPDPWASMFAAAVERRGDDDSDLVPYWVYPLDGGAQIERYAPALPLSADARQLADLKRSMAAYRLVFGQPRQEDLVAFLKDRLDPEELERLLGELRIDVSPQPLSNARRDELRAAPSIEISSLDGESEQVAARADTAVTHRKQQYRRFWELVLEGLRRSRLAWRLRTPGPRNWFELPVQGLRSAHAGLRSGYVIVFASGQRLRIELYVDDRDPDQQRAAWGNFVAARTEIEARFGEPLTWEELPKRRASRIACYYPGDAPIDDEGRWADYVRWIVPSAERLRVATMP